MIFLFLLLRVIIKLCPLHHIKYREVEIAVHNGRSPGILLRQFLSCFFPQCSLAIMKICTIVTALLLVITGEAIAHQGISFYHQQNQWRNTGSTLRRRGAGSNHGGSKILNVWNAYRECILLFRCGSCFSCLSGFCWCLVLHFSPPTIDRGSKCLGVSRSYPTEQYQYYFNVLSSNSWFYDHVRLIQIGRE